MKRALTFILIIFCAEINYAQNAKIDSLNNRIRRANTDTGRIKLLVTKAIILSSINLDSAINLDLRTLEETGKIHYYRAEVDLRVQLVYDYAYKGNYKAALEQINYLKQYVNSSIDSTDFGKVYGTTGLLYGMQSKYDSSIYFYEKAIRIYKKVGNNELLGICYSNIAIAYQQKSNFPMALLYFQKALKISEESKNEIHQAYANINIGNTYSNMGDSARAESTYLKDIELAKKNLLKNVELYCYTNLSTMYINEKKWQKSYEFALKAAELGGAMGDQGIEAASFSKAATSLAMLNEPEKAIAISKKAIAIADSSAQPLNIFQAYSSMGTVLKNQKKWKEAIPFYEKGFASIKDADLYAEANGILFRELSECYEKTGNYTKALSAYQKSAMIADSVGRKDNIRKATELTMNYEFDKKEQTLKTEQKAKDAITHIQKVALITGLILSLIIIAGAFIGFRNKQKANALLRKQKEEIENTLIQLKNTQAQLIQAEKMASLGQLIAGIAHEINTPLGAIKASVGAIIDSSFQSLKQLPEVIKKLNNNEFAIFLELVNRSVQNNVNITSKEEREHRKNLTAELETHGIENADNFSDLLVDMAIYDNIEPYFSIFNEQNLQAAFQISQQMKNSQNIKTAVDRASKIVFALKSYARNDQAQEMVMASIPETIETVLTIYHNQLKNGINLTKKFDQVPQIFCYPDELNQVWTNLIHNAAQAMNGTGDLSISIEKPDATSLQISVSDTGNGIPPENLEKIFDAFYTTKPAGEGSGLGLYIVKQIIDKHQGKISVRSELGKGTTFFIKIPLLEVQPVFQSLS
jgi:two-component system NtrC family sensor kinase